MKIQELLENVKVGEQNVIDVTGAPGDRKLTIASRKMLPEEPRAPKRAESPARSHEFLSAASLADYLERYGSKNTVVFADPQGELVSAVLEEGAKDGFEVVTMKPQIHPLWKPWADLAGKKLSLEEFAAFVGENRRSVVTPPGRDLVLLLSQVTAGVTVEIQKGRGRSSVNGIKVTTRVQSGQTQTADEDLPERIVVKCPLYVQTHQREIELDLSVEATADGKVRVLVTAGTVAEARVNAFEEMVALIRKATSEKGGVVTYGRPQHADRVYLREAVAAAPAAPEPKPVYPR